MKNIRQKILKKQKQAKQWHACFTDSVNFSFTDSFNRLFTGRKGKTIYIFFNILLIFNCEISYCDIKKFDI
jgi:hypothetical protein